MKYRAIPDIYPTPSPFLIHKIQARIFGLWFTIGRVLTTEQADVALKMLEDLNKKKG